MSKEETSQVHHEVTAMLRNYYKDINEQGLLAELKYLDNSADFSWRPPGFNSYISYDSAEAIIRKNAVFISSGHITWDSLSVTPISPDTAKYIGRITSAVTDTSGFSITLRLKEEGVVVRRKDGWKLVSGETVLVNK